MEQIKINELAMKELEKQDEQIEELKGVLKSLRIEEARRNQINSVCDNNKQSQLNYDYHTIKKLTKEGVIPKKSTEINLKLPHNKSIFDVTGFKSGNNSNYSNKSNSSTSKNKKCKNKCPNIDTKKMIHTSKLRNNVCIGCEKKVLENENVIKTFSN